nr:ATP-dependent DNA ligase [Candidatus Njordarchaeota archaeon]
MSSGTLFSDLCLLMEKLESTRKRGEMIWEVAEFLNRLRQDEMIPATLFLTGRVFPGWDERTLEVNGATLWKVILRTTSAKPEELGNAFDDTGDLGDAVKNVFMRRSTITRQDTLLSQNPLTILAVKQNLEELASVSGAGSRRRKERIVEGLLTRASPMESKFIIRMLLGEMRTGFQEGLLTEAVSKAFSVPSDLVRKAAMITGDIGVAAEAAKAGGELAVKSIELEPFMVIKPMLAAMSSGVKEALQEHGGASAFEYKLDGARVQIHVSSGVVRIWSRRLTEVTDSLPEVVELIRSRIKASKAILEGEVVAIGHDGKPLPFQHLMRRFRRKHEIEKSVQEIPTELYLFDLLYVSGESLIDKPYTERRKRLSEVADGMQLVRSIVANNVENAQKFLEEALNVGHEGLVAKKLDGPYTPGTRGKKWLKIKRVMEPLDLVITEAEYGYGRRHEWLSDYTLSARDEDTGKFVPLGKTFKGLTDEEIKEMTNRLKELMISKHGRRVIVKPEVVVEVVFNEIQESPKYESGMALRFARIARVRSDKSPSEADTIAKIKELYNRQFSYKSSGFGVNEKRANAH